MKQNTNLWNDAAHVGIPGRRVSTGPFIGEGAIWWRWSEGGFLLVVTPHASGVYGTAWQFVVENSGGERILWCEDFKTPEAAREAADRHEPFRAAAAYGMPPRPRARRGPANRCPARWTGEERSPR